MTPDSTSARALVTGASSGIGRELARLIAADGQHLILVGRSADSLASFARELVAASGVEVLSIVEDLATPGAAGRVFDSVQKHALVVTTLVNNAGAGVYGEFAETRLEDELQIIALNVSALVSLTKLFLPDMLRRKSGRILQVASTAAFVPGPNMAVYYATKAFVLSFSEALRDELRESPVTVSVLCPGPTATNFHHRAGAIGSRLFTGVVMNAAEVAAVGYRGLVDG
jgi:short-subunit dehydrogenase